MPLFNRTRLTLFKSIMPKSMSKGQERYLKALVLVFLLLLLVLTIAHTEDNPDWYFVVPGLLIHLSADSFLILITSAFVAVATRHFIIPNTMCERQKPVGMGPQASCLLVSHY